MCPQPRLQTKQRLTLRNQIPSNLILYKLGPTIWIGGQVFAWLVVFLREVQRIVMMRARADVFPGAWLLHSRLSSMASARTMLQDCFLGTLRRRDFYVYYCGILMLVLTEC